MPISAHLPINEEHEESFFISMTDMMVGIIFLFIIMLMFFAMKFSDDSIELTVENRRLQEQYKKLQEQKSSLQATLDLLKGAWQTRQQMVDDIYTSLKLQGVKVSVDDAHGILRLPEDILFAVNSAELSATGRDAVSKLARTLANVLPCYTTQEGKNRSAECPPIAYGLEALLIEGHTDTDGSEEVNWPLSVNRALRTYQVLVKECPDLANMKSLQRQGQDEEYPVLSVAGYGSRRPVKKNDTAENKRLNRRIDIRFLMTPPDQKVIDAAGRLLQ